MEKFLKIPIQTLKVASSTTTTPSGSNNLTDTSATFTADGVVAGDIVWVTTDNLVETISEVVDETNLKFVSGDTIAASKDYVIMSGTESVERLLSLTDVLNVVQGDEDGVYDECKVTVTYNVSDLTGDQILLLHATKGSSAYTARNVIQDSLVSALKKVYQESAVPLINPSQVKFVSIGIV